MADMDASPRLDEIAIDLRALLLALAREAGHLRVERGRCTARLDEIERAAEIARRSAADVAELRKEHAQR